MKSTLRAKAMEAYTRDVGRSIARLDPESIEKLDLSDGDFLEIRGTSTTAAKCLPLYPSDWCTGILRIDGLIRHNAGISVGEPVEIKKASVSPARRILITPLGGHTEVTNTFIRQWQQSEEPVESRFAVEVLSGTPIVNGDFVMIDYHLSKMFFLILEKEPSDDISVVGRMTRIELIPWITA